MLGSRRSDELKTHLSDALRERETGLDGCHDEGGVDEGEVHSI